MAFNEQDKKTLQMGLFLAAILVGGALVFKFQINKLAKQQVEAQITQIDNQIREQRVLKNDLLNLADREQEILAMAAQIQEASRRLPSTPEAREFYESLVNIIRETQLSWNELIPVRTREHQMYVEYPYTLDAESSYHDFGGLLNLVETDPDRFMRISRIDFHSQRENPTIHPMNIEITTFMLTEGEGA